MNSQDLYLVTIQYAVLGIFCQHLKQSECMLIVMLLFRQFSSNSSSSYSSVSVVFLYCIHLYSQKDCRSTPIMAYIPTICCFWGQKNTSVVRLDTKCQKEKRYPLLSQLDPLFAGRWLFGVWTKTLCFKKRQQRKNSPKGFGQKWLIMVYNSE